MQEDYTEINLKDLFWSILCRWKALLAALLIGGVLLGAFGAFREYRNISDAKGAADRQAAYEAALETYQLSKGQLEVDLKNLRAAQESQQHYQENALMLTMDQYNVSFITASYTVELGPQVTEEELLKSMNYASAVLKRYQAVIMQIDLDKVIATPEQPELTAVNPAGSTRRLLEVSTDEIVSVLNLTIRADSEARAEKIYDAVKETISREEEALAGSAGPSVLTKISESRGADVDQEIGKVQTAFKTNVKTVADSIAETEKNLDALKAQTNTVPSVRSMIKKAVKYGVVGAAAGLLAAGFFLLLKYVLQDRLSSTEEAVRRYRLPVLGTIDESGKKKSKADRFLERRLGFNARGSADAAADFAASNIRFQLKDGSRVLLVGSCGAEKLNTLKNQLASRLENVEIIAAGNVNEEAAALDVLRSEGAVVCVEEWMKTPHRDIRRELQTVADSGNRNLGMIVLR